MTKLSKNCFVISLDFVIFVHYLGLLPNVILAAIPGFRHLAPKIFFRLAYG